MTTTTTPGPATGTVQLLLRMYRNEMRLFFRELQVLVFVFGFPIVTVLILGGVFGNGNDDEGFEFVNPQHFYVAAYFGVVLAAIGLIMLPAHVASYRERGVLRRFDTAGFPIWAFPAVQFLAGITFALMGFSALIVTAFASSGFPGMENAPRTLLGLAAGTATFVSIGVALGMLLPSGRAAQGLGLTLFFPMFLLAGGGPPPEALSPTMKQISQFMPLSHVIRAAQEPWLGLGDGIAHLWILLGVFVAATAVWLVRSSVVVRSA